MKKIILLIVLIIGIPQTYGALSNSVCAGLVVDEIKILNTGLTGAAETQAISYWTAICKGLLDHIKASADINLLAGDIPVPALGLLDSLSLPVTGAAVSGPALLTGKIQ